jgi:hypothetical protein
VRIVDGMYCRICQDHQEREECERRLSAQLFTQRDDVCNTCVRRSQRSLHRTAMEGTVEEHEITTAGDADVYVFLNQHEGEITRFLEETVNRNG